MARNRARIRCVNKTNRTSPHERIHSVGGVGSDGPWKISEDRAIELIDSGDWAFYTHEDGTVADVIVASHLGHRYLKTVADGQQPDNLLKLPECPS